MKMVDSAISASNMPNQKTLHKLAIADNVCLATAAVLAAIILMGWLVPGVGSTLPQGWSLMKFNTALATLLCTASLTLTRPKQNSRLFLAARICAGVAVFLAGAALFEHWSGRSYGLGTLLAADTGAQLPGRMSRQTGSFFVLLGLSLTIEWTRQGLLGHVLDALIAALVIFSLVLVAGYVFHAPLLYGQSAATHTSPQTLACLALLTFVLANRRAPYGSFSVLVGVGIGSQFARTALPITLLIVFLSISAGTGLLAAGYLTLPYAAALTASSMAALLFFLVVVMARQLNELERKLRNSSLSDELTGLHNRRGFYILGEQALHHARRVAEPLAVLFIDVNGLKKVNDTLGHDIGSELLRDIAGLLRNTFRTSDVIGRLGGDEFAVVCYGRSAELTIVLRRLVEATDVANFGNLKTYQISFSIGAATTEPRSKETFSALIDRADAAMYQEKILYQAARETRGATQQAAPGDAKPLLF